MPSKNILKTYIANGYYHVYNRGVEKRVIFEDEQDYRVFLKYIEEILTPPKSQDKNTTFNLRGRTYKAEKKFLKNYTNGIDLLAYCLMPNHFHFLVKLRDVTALEGYMRALMTRYVMYFNKKYDRIGSLFQGRYKAVLITDERYLLHLSRYIHLNPSEYTRDLEGAYSSYADYLGKRKTPWIKTDEVLPFFNANNIIDFKNVSSYKNFVEKYKMNSSEILGDFILE